MGFLNRRDCLLNEGSGVGKVEHPESLGQMRGTETDGLAENVYKSDTRNISDGHSNCTKEAVSPQT